MWKYRELKKRVVEGPERWEFLTTSGLAGPLTQIKVGGSGDCVCVYVCVSVMYYTYTVGLSAISPSCQQWRNCANPSRACYECPLQSTGTYSTDTCTVNVQEQHVYT